jgi:hypothetical protein
VNEPGAVVASAEEVEDLRQLRALLSPAESIRVLDDFAKWLFAGATAAGSLGAGFGLTAVDDLGGLGRWLFVGAVGCVAVTLALTAWARMPVKTTPVNRYSVDSMQAEIDRIARRRHLILVGAAASFALSLVLAAVAAAL